MDEWFEIEGRSKQDAIERACNALNTNESHLKYEIVGQTGGITKIRAMKTETPTTGGSTDAPREAAPIAPPRADDESEIQATDESEPAEIKPDDRVYEGNGEQAKEILLTLVHYIDEKAVVELKETKDHIHLEIKGEHGGLLIGKYGQTLGALQYLVGRMAKLDRINSKRLVLDTEQYRARRQESLEILAKRLAEKAIRSGRSVGAEPMSAADRRILHMALKDDPEIQTKSVGDGSARRVLIVPKNGSNRGAPARRNGRPRNGNRPNRFDRPDRQDNNAEPRRRAGPPPRLHDSFDTPPDPEGDFFDEEPDAPIMGDAEAPVQEQAALPEDKD